VLEREFIILTNNRYSDIATPCEPSPHSAREFIEAGAGLPSSLFSQKEQRKTAKITAGVPLLFSSPDRRQPRIFAKNEKPLAVNFPP
jgi:hypothetical protein